MKRKVILTCALTGGADLNKNSKYVPVTPKQIAEEGVAAADAGAAVLHIHVRDPNTGKASMEFDLYREVVERIRDSGRDVLINLTTGVGAWYMPPIDDPRAAEVVVKPPEERIKHIVTLKPHICTLDIATMNFDRDAIVNTPDHLRYMAKRVKEVSVRPELEVFDLGQIDLALRLVEEGALPTPPFFQCCLGIRGGAPATPETLILMRSHLPRDAVWSAFGISRAQMPIVALSVVLGGHVRVGLEDNLFIAPGELAKGNAPLVERGVKIIEGIGEEVATPAEARKILSIPG